jgi:hypothetical protein
MNMPTNHTDAERILAGHDERKIGNNTYLIRRADGIAVRLHSTDVVTFHSDNTITLNSGGYRTYTTKDRMNACLRQYRVFQHNWNWYISAGGAQTEYFDGIRLHA